MIFPYAVVVVLVSALLIGCSDSSAPVPPVNGVAGGADKETLLYLPGGGGLNFGKKFTSSGESVSKDGLRKSRFYTYEFSESITEVATSIEEVMRSYSYSRSSLQDKRYARHDSYEKNAKKVGFAFEEKVKEGLVKKTVLTIWYVELI